ncbi:MAG: redoxin domain-containing protein [Deltaproteobacteria bacterium]|nr:redoxin domain-containing protein [Deltaproteobacteria bacterium]
MKNALTAHICVLFTFVLLPLATTLARLAPPARADDDIPTLAIGASAPNFDLPGVDGKNHKLDEYAKSDVLAVVFTCNHCPTAQYYEDRLKSLVTTFKGKSVSFVMISPNDPDAVRPDELGYTDLSDSFDDMKLRAADRKFNFPYLFGGGKYEATSKAYGPKATPHAFVFDKARKLRYSGRVDDSERVKLVKKQDLRDAITALLTNKPIETPVQKAFGCSTKWSNKRADVKDYWSKIAKEPVTVKPLPIKDAQALRANKDSGKFRLVNFWATWCGPCVTEFPELMQMNRQYRGRDFELVTVAAQFPDEEKQVLAFLKKQQASNANYLFGDNDKYALMESFDKKWEGGLPFTMLLDPKGKVLYQKQGSIEVQKLKALIVKALNAHQPW